MAVRSVWSLCDSFHFGGPVPSAIDVFPTFLNKHIIRLTVDQRPVEVRFNSTEWENFWRPFLGKLAEAKAQVPRRMLVAVAGAPGSGKSMFAAQLSWLLNNKVISGITSARVVAGWVPLRWLLS